jgi:two-component sensor histidine kinase
VPRGADAASIIPTRPGIEFGTYLRALCADAAPALDPENGVIVTCTVAETLLPTATVVRLGLIAKELVTNWVD